MEARAEVVQDLTTVSKLLQKCGKEGKEVLAQYMFEEDIKEYLNCKVYRL